MNRTRHTAATGLPKVWTRNEQRVGPTAMPVKRSPRVRDSMRAREKEGVQSVMYAVVVAVAVAVPEANRQ